MSAITTPGRRSFQSAEGMEQLRHFTQAGQLSVYVVRQVSFDPDGTGVETRFEHIELACSSVGDIELSRDAAEYLHRCLGKALALTADPIPARVAATPEEN